MKEMLSRRDFLAAATAAVPLSAIGSHAATPAATPAASPTPSTPDTAAANRIVDVHVHFDESIPTFLDDFRRVSDKLNLTACLLTPFAHRKVVADAARKYPTQI